MAGRQETFVASEPLGMVLEGFQLVSQEFWERVGRFWAEGVAGTV